MNKKKQVKNTNQKSPKRQISYLKKSSDELEIL